MKKSTGKLLIGLAVGVLLAGGIGAIAYGSDGFTNSDISTWFDGEWRAIELEDQTKEYTGSKVEPDITLPEGFTYEIVKIEKDGEEISLETGAVDEGDYVFTIKVSKDDESKEYFCNLTIVRQESLNTNFVENGIKLKSNGIMTLATGTSEVISYEVQPADALQTVNVAVRWADDGSSETDDDSFKSNKTATSYITATADSTKKEVTITNVSDLPFGSQIEVVLTSTMNSSVSGIIKVDYRKKITGGSLSSVREPNFYMDNNTFCIKGYDGTLYTLQEFGDLFTLQYSVGTLEYVGDKNFTIDVTHFQTGAGIPSSQLFIGLKSDEACNYLEEQLNNNNNFLDVVAFGNLFNVSGSNGFTVSQQMALHGSHSNVFNITSNLYCDGVLLGDLAEVTSGCLSHLDEVWTDFDFSSAIKTIEVGGNVIF